MFYFDHAAQRYKALFHQGGGGLDGGYAQSRTADFFGEWDYERRKGAYGATIDLVGGESLTVSRRERPKLYVENGTLQLLINGVCLEGAWGSCFTFAQPINQSVPWLAPSPERD